MIPACHLPAICKEAYYVCMKRLAAVALMACVFALPASAQRSTGHSGFAGNSSQASHGGFAGHSSQAPHGGFHANAPRSFSPRASGNFIRPGLRPGLKRQTFSPHSAPGRSVTMPRGEHRGGGNSGDRRGEREHRHHRRPYVSPFNSGLFVGYPGYGVSGWVDLNSPGYPDTIGTDDSEAAPDQTNAEPAGEYDSQPEEPWQPPSRAPYPAASALPSPSQAPQSEEAVTLVFKDGRPPEQIHNYILTRNTVFVGDGNRREIPTDQLDLAATAKANQDAGVDFSLPGASE